jgi:hypothetical protein
LQVDSGAHIVVNSLNKNAGNILILINGNIVINGEVRNEVSGTNGLPGSITIISKCGNLTEGKTGLIQILGTDFGANTISLVTCGDNNSDGDITINGLVKSFAHAHGGNQNLNRPNIKVVSFNGKVTVNANTVEPLYDEFQVAGSKYDIWGGLLSWVRDNVQPGKVEVQAKKDITVNGHGIDPTGPVRTSFGAIAAIATASDAPGGLVDVRSLEGNIFGNDRAFDVSGRNRLATNFAHIRLWSKLNIVLNRPGANNNFNPVVDASSPSIGDKGGTNELRSYSGGIMVGANALVSAAVPLGNGSVQGANMLTSCLGVTGTGSITPADTNPADNSGICPPGNPAAPVPLYTDCTQFYPPVEDLGCNPTTAQINAAFGTATATDNCGTVTLTFVDGPVISTGCNRSQTRTWTATDGCGNTATVSVTVTWKKCPCTNDNPVVVGDRTNNQLGSQTPENGKLTVVAFPNPYKDYFTLRINAPVSGEGLIEIFTSNGTKIAEIKRDMNANEDTYVSYFVSPLMKTRIIYKVTIGNYKSTGIVLSPN